MGTITKGAGGALNITGGVLSADRVEFSLTNTGGVLSPGDTIGTTTVVGNATLASARWRLIWRRPRWPINCSSPAHSRSAGRSMSRCLMVFHQQVVRG